MSLQILLDARFERVGAWRIGGTAASMELDGNAGREAGVYAFVVDGVIHYIGSAQRGLHGRFRRYVTSRTLRTSTRIRSNIIACLREGKAVEVYALQPQAVEWRSLPVDLVTGLEEGLIRSVRPAWNRRSNPRKGRRSEVTSMRPQDAGAP
jgi:hypothetical protein